MHLLERRLLSVPSLVCSWFGMCGQHFITYSFYPIFMQESSSEAVSFKHITVLLFSLPSPSNSLGIYCLCLTDCIVIYLKKMGYGRGVLWSDNGIGKHKTPGPLGTVLPLLESPTHPPGPLHVCLCMCVCVHVHHMCTWRLWRPERASYLLQLD